jgi:pyruvate/2-oxoglutarate dehydrogenase complex dihydrolipoamide dehydrogenase (E3) component
VGLNEREAQAMNINYGIAKLPMTWVARALEMDESRGFMKAIIDTDTEQIIGCSILGIEGGEIAAIIQMAMMGKVPYSEIRDTVFSHPTLAESLNNLFANIESHNSVVSFPI